MKRHQSSTYQDVGYLADLRQIVGDHKDWEGYAIVKVEELSGAITVSRTDDM